MYFLYFFEFLLIHYKLFRRVVYVFQGMTHQEIGPREEWGEDGESQNSA
jgi:hypothetical protein